MSDNHFCDFLSGRCDYDSTAILADINHQIDANEYTELWRVITYAYLMCSGIPLDPPE